MPADPETSEDPPRRYVLVESDRYAAERDQAVLSRNRTLGPGYAQRWYTRLSQKSADLAGFPGPFAHARDEAASDVIGREVRRFLYYGPTNKRTGTPVRILYTVLPPAPDEPPPWPPSRSSSCSACSMARRHCSRKRTPNPDARRAA